MRFLFYVHSRFGKAVEDLDYSEKHPMGGSETAVLWLAKTLQQMGHEVKVTAELEECASPVDFLVILRDWEALEKVQPTAKLVYLWCQDDADQPFLQPLRQKETAERAFRPYNAVITPSCYAAKGWAEQLNAPLDKLEVIPSAVPLHLFVPNAEQLAARPPHAYYASTPQRGLRELVQVWPKIMGKIPEARLFIASSMQTYHSEDNPALQQLFQQAQTLPGATYLGALNQVELRKLAQKCRALAYPCTFPETGCIAAMEAMAAGCAVVSTALGALPETAWRNPLVEPAEGWLDLWAEELVRIFTDDAHYLDIAQSNLALSRQMDWPTIAQKWLLRIKSDLAAFQPTN